jgi:hypothetical protein
LKARQLRHPIQSPIIALEGSPKVLWAGVKTTLAISIPFCAIAYAREVQLEGECHRIQAILERPTDIEWALSHRQELVERNRAEARDIEPMLRDLSD